MGAQPAGATLFSFSLLDDEADADAADDADAVAAAGESRAVMKMLGSQRYLVRFPD